MIFLVTHLFPKESIELISNYVVVIVLIISILMTGCRRLETMVKLFIIQSFGIITIMLFAGSLNSNPNIYLFCGITFLGKCILVPWILLFVLKKIRINREVETYIGLPASMLLSCVLAALIFEIIPNIGIEKELQVLSSGLLKTSISIIFIGLFIMMTRKKAFAQIMGLYVMENGIFALTVDTIFEMPQIVEMGVLLDILLGALVMGVWVYRIKQSFETINVEKLRKLKG